MKYAICNETFAGWGHGRVCDRVAELGYAGLEVAPFTLAPRVTDVPAGRRAELRRRAEGAGLRILGLHWLFAHTDGFHLTSPDPDTRRRTGDYLSALADAAADLGGDILVLGSPKQRGVPPGHTPAEAADFFLDALGRCLETLDRQRVTLCLEPLGPEETDFLNTAADAVALIRRLGHPRVRLHLDVKAMATEQAPIPDTVRANAGFLRHFHANDPNRRGPGSGDADFRPVFTALRDIGYDGWVSVEVFDTAPDPDTVARRSIEYMRSCE